MSIVHRVYTLGYIKILHLFKTILRLAECTYTSMLYLMCTKTAVIIYVFVSEHIESHYYCYSIRLTLTYILCVCLFVAFEKEMLIYESHIWILQELLSIQMWLKKQCLLPRYTNGYVFNMFVYIEQKCIFFWHLKKKIFFSLIHSERISTLLLMLKHVIVQLSNFLNLLSICFESL